MGARHLYNVLLEHPDLFCLTVKSEITALPDEALGEDRLVLHTFTSRTTLNQYLDANRVASQSYCRIAGADLVARLCSKFMSPLPDGIRLHSSAGSAFLSALELTDSLATRTLRDLLSSIIKTEAKDEKLSKTREQFMSKTFYCVPHVDLGSEKQRILLTVDEKQRMPLFGDPSSAEFFAKGLETQFEEGQLKSAPEVSAVYPEEFPDLLQHVEGFLFEPMWDEVPGEPVPLLLDKAQLLWLFEADPC